MNEDTLYPHSDEAGRVPGAMSPGRAIYCAEEFTPEVLAEIQASTAKHERQRLVWEAMKVHLSSGADRRLTLEMAINDVDKYLAWRDGQ